MSIEERCHKLIIWQGLKQGINILKISWHNILFSQLWSLAITALTWNYFPIYLRFGFSSIYSICLWFVEFSFEINRTPVHMGRVFYTLRIFLATLVTTSFYFCWHRRFYKEHKSGNLPQERGNSLFAYSTKKKKNQLWISAGRISFLRIIHVLCWTATLPILQPVLWSLSCCLFLEFSSPDLSSALSKSVSRLRSSALVAVQ